MGRVAGPPAHLGQRRAGQARRVALDQQRRDATGPLVGRVGAHRHGDEVSPHARGDEHLLAIDDVVIARAVGASDRRGLERRNVRTTGGLGHRQRGDLLPSQHRRDHPGLQRSAAIGLDRRQAYGVRHQGGRNPPAARPGQFLRHDQVVEQIDRSSTEFLRIAQPEQADRRGLAVQLARKGLGFVPFVDMGGDLRGHPGAQ